MIARICWCRTCQKISANGTANSIFPSAAIEVTGAMNCFTSTEERGNQISRHFCPNCGSHLFASSSATPQFRVVRLGTLDDPSSICRRARRIGMYYDRSGVTTNENQRHSRVGRAVPPSF
jgi:hypothetical protein